MGGLVNHLDKKQQGLAASLIIGVIVALPFTWLYVFLALPNVNTSVLHSQISAVMVSILGGIGGAAALKGISKKAGLNLFDES